MKPMSFKILTLTILLWRIEIMSHIIHAHAASNIDHHDEDTTSFVERAVPVLSTIVSITIRIAISRLIGSPAMC